MESMLICLNLLVYPLNIEKAFEHRNSIWYFSVLEKILTQSKRFYTISSEMYVQLTCSDYLITLIVIIEWPLVSIV